MKQASLLVATALFLVLFCTCAAPEDSRSARPTGWETGYWVWGYDTERPVAFEGEPQADVIYIQARRLRQRFVLPWSDELPRARAYFIVFRMETAFGFSPLPARPG